MFLSRADRNVRELLELPQECQGNFLSSGGKVGFPSRRLSGKGPHLYCRGEPPGFSRVAADPSRAKMGDLKDPLLWPQERPVTM